MNVNLWAVIFLGIIAATMLATAIAQVGVLVAAGRLARRIDRLAGHVEQELKPIFSHLNAIGRDASHATSLAAAQVERADRLFADLAQRVEQAVDGLQAGLAQPARETRAFFSGLKAAFQVIREVRDGGRRRRSRADDEDALFI